MASFGTISQKLKTPEGRKELVILTRKDDELGESEKELVIEALEKAPDIFLKKNSWFDALQGVLARNKASSNLNRRSVFFAKNVEVTRIRSSNPGSGGRKVTQSKVAAPDTDAIDAFNLKKLENAIGVKASQVNPYDSLTEKAREGVYILLRIGVPESNIARVLKSSAVANVGPKALSHIFETVVKLYQYGVHGIERGFIPDTKTDDRFSDYKFLSDDPSRVYSTIAEYVEALEQAQKTGLPVEIEAVLEIDWSDLTEEQDRFLKSYVEPMLSDGFRESYRKQSEVKVDVMVGRPGTKQHIVEVKTSLYGNLQPDEESRAAIILQVFRHALLVRQHRLEGKDFHARSAKTDAEFAEKLKEAHELASEIFDAPYIVRGGAGDNRWSLADGLDYMIGFNPMPQLALPPLPEEKITSSATASEVGAEESQAASVAMLEPETSDGLKTRSADPAWSDATVEWLDRAIPGSMLKVGKYDDVDQFVTGFQSALRIKEQREVLRQIRKILDSEGESVQKEVSPLVDQFSRGIKRTMSRSSILALVRIAQIATASERLPSVEVEGVTLEDDDIQHLLVEKFNIENSLRLHLAESESTFAEVDSMLEDGDFQSLEGLAYLQSEIDSVSATQFAAIRNIPVNLSSLLALMEKTSKHVDWDAELKASAWSVMAGAAKLSRYIESKEESLPAPLPHSIMEVFKPIPEDLLESMVKMVMSLGELPKSDSKHEVSRIGTGNAARVESYDRARALSYYNQLTTYSEKDGAEGNLYYYPDDLRLIEQLVRGYLRSCGWEDERIDEEMPGIRKEALAALGGGVAVASLDEIIPEGFVRSDLVYAKSPITGMDIDMTSLAAVLWRKERKNVSDFIRIAVLRNGKKVYFVNRFALEKSGIAARYPDANELGAIMRDGASLKRFLKLLGSEGGEFKDDKNLHLRVRRFSENGAASVSLASKSEAEKASLTYYSIFEFKRNADSIKLVKASGTGAIDLAVAYLEGKLGEKMKNKAENHVAISLLGMDARAGREVKSKVKNANIVSAADFNSYLADPAFAERLEKMYQAVNDKPLGESFIISGRRDSEGLIYALKLPTEDMVSAFYPDTFILRFERREDGFTLVKADGGGAAYIALGYFESRLGFRIENPVERRIAAGLVGARFAQQSGGLGSSMQNLAIMLLDDEAMGRLAKIFQLVKGGDLPDALWLKGAEFEDQVRGLNLLADGSSVNSPYFYLKLVKEGEGYRFELPHNPTAPVRRLMTLTGMSVESVSRKPKAKIINGESVGKTPSEPRIVLDAVVEVSADDVAAGDSDGAVDDDNANDSKRPRRGRPRKSPSVKNSGVHIQHPNIGTPK